MANEACPNPTSKEWRAVLEKTKNVFEAYRIFIKNGYQVPDFVFKTGEDVYEYLDKLAKDLKILSKVEKVNKNTGEKYYDYYIPYGKDHANWVLNSKLMNDEKDRINNLYGELITIKDSGITPENKVYSPGRGTIRTPNRTKIDQVFVNEHALTMHYRIYEKERKQMDAESGENIVPYDTYEQKIDDRVSPENRVDFEKKKEIMLKNFPRVKQVIEDYSIASAGTLENNGTIIRVNPNYWTKDTIGHEFGHLLIDLMGGTNNPLIRKGINQLRGTELWIRTKELYPDLFENNMDKFEKEVLAQAIGEDTATIFDTEKEQSDFRKWLDAFFRKLKQILGIEEKVAKQLARKILDSNVIDLDSLDIDGTYEQRIGEKARESVSYEDTTKSKVELLREQAISVLEKKQDRYQKQNYKHKEELLKNTLEKIKKVDSDPVEVLKSFQNFAVTETQRIYNDYLAVDRKNRMYNTPFNLRQLTKWKDYLSGFALLNDFVKLASSVDSELEQGVLDLELLNTALNQKTIIEKVYTEEGIKLVSQFLSPYSKHVEVEYKEDIEREYNSLSKEEKQNINKEDFIKEKLETFKEEIKKVTQLRIDKELKEASRDINMLSRWIDNVLDSPDVVVSSLARAVYEADFKSRNEYKDLEYNMFDKVKTLEDYYKSKGLSTSDQKSVYGFMLEKDKDGNYTQNIVDVYKSSLWETYNSYVKGLEEAGLSYDEVLSKKKIWKKNNMPLDYDAFNKVKVEFYKSLLTRELVTKEELIELEANDNYENVDKRDPSEILSSDVAAQLVSEFFVENIWKYRNPINIWKSEQWSELVKMAGGNESDSIGNQRKAVEENKTKDPRVDFYNFIVTNRNNIQKETPYGHRLHTRLPSVLKTSSERLESKDNTITDALKFSMDRELNVLADDDTRGERILTTESGKPLHFIPIYYTADIRKIYEYKYDKLSDEEKEKITKEEYINRESDQNQSYDIASIYSRYFQSAIDYKHKNEILPEIEMARDLVNNRQMIVRDGKGNVVLNAFNKVKDKVATKEALSSGVTQQLNDWFEAIIYGIKEKDEGTLFGGKVDAAKGANALNKFTALNMLAVNFVQGTANVILGSTNQAIESFGKDNYTPKDMAKANAIYGKNLPGILGDIGSRKSKNIISLLLDRFDVLNEYDKAEFRKNSVFKQLLTTNTLFFTAQAGEHFMQTKVLLAMLNKLQAIDKDGNIIGPMLDQISVDNSGKLKINENVKNFSIKEQAEFEGRVRRVLSSLHGEYSELGRVAIQRYALGRMAYMFRKFVVPGVKRRYGRKNVNNILGEYTEGYYRTTGRFLAVFAKDLRNFQLTLMYENWNNLTDKEKANIRKTLIESTFMLSATILASILVNIKDDDDDEDWLLSFMGYQALRFKTEMWFFTNPSEAMKILRSPAAAMSVVENVIKLTGQLLPPDFEGFERYERGNWKGRYKINKTLVNFVPVLKQGYRLKYIDDQSLWLK